MGKVFPETKIVTLLYHFILTCHITMICLKYIKYVERFPSIYRRQWIFNSPYFLEDFSELIRYEKMLEDTDIQEKGILEYVSIQKDNLNLNCVNG